MISLTFASLNESNVIKKISGAKEEKLYLEGLGFTPGAEVKILNVVGDNLLICLKESRVAISKELAKNIMI